MAVVCGDVVYNDALIFGIVFLAYRQVRYVTAVYNTFENTYRSFQRFAGVCQDKALDFRVPSVQQYRSINCMRRQSGLLVCFGGFDSEMYIRTFSQSVCGWEGELVRFGTKIEQGISLQHGKKG